MAASRVIVPFVWSLACMASLVTAQEAKVAEGGGDDPVGRAALKVTGIGKAPESKRGTPQGRLMAERAAELTAKRNLALAIGKVTVEGTDREKKIFVDAFVRGARLTDKKTKPDGSVEVTMELPLAEVARNFAEMQRLALRAEENRHKLEEVFRKTETDLRSVKAKLNAFQEAVAEMEDQIKRMETRGARPE